MNTTQKFARHIPSGDIFAIDVDSIGNVVAVSTALHYLEVKEKLLGYFATNPEDAEWFAGESFEVLLRPYPGD